MSQELIKLCERCDKPLAIDDVRWRCDECFKLVCVNCFCEEHMLCTECHE